MSRKQPAVLFFQGGEWVYHLGLFLAIIFLYQDALFTSYAFSDDYAFLESGISHHAKGFLAAQASAGRPVIAILNLPVFQLASNIEELSRFRALNLIALWILAISSFWTMRKACWAKWPSALFAFMVCALPSFQFYVAGWVHYFPVPISAALGLFAARQAIQALEARRIRAIILRLMLAIVINSTVFMIYQPIAMMYWFFLAVFLFSPDCPAAPGYKRIPILFLPPLFSGLFALGIQRLGSHFYPNSNFEIRSRLASDFYMKADWFFREPLLNALNLFSIHSSLFLPLITAGFLVVGLYYYLRTKTSRYGTIFLMILFIPCSYLPNLLTGENWASYRTIGALSSLALIYSLIRDDNEKTFAHD